MMMKKVLFLVSNSLLFLFFTLFSSACSTRSTWASDPRVNRETAQESTVAAYEKPEEFAHQGENGYAKGIYHKLKSGETLYLVSRLYQVPLNKLISANRINDPSRIPAGTLIFVPGPRLPSPERPAITFSWPLSGRITTKFGPRGKRWLHEGIDIDGEYGDEVAAAADGTVVESRTRRNYGRIVVIDHGHGLATVYAHLSTLLVEVGDRIQRGDVIARVGRSGNATGSHLHFEVRRNGRAVNPLPYLRSDAVLNATR